VATWRPKSFMSADRTTPSIAITIRTRMETTMTRRFPFESANRQLTPRSRLGASRVLVGAAALADTVHAGFSLYWGLGGTWLLATVGQAAVRLSVNASVQAGIAQL
jgi:hypothetical protein